MALDKLVALDKPVPVGGLLHAPQLLRHVESMKVGLAVHSPACVHSVHRIDWSAQGAMTGGCDCSEGCGVGSGLGSGRTARSCAGDVGSVPAAGVHVSQHSDCMKCGLRAHSPALAHCPHSRLVSTQLASSAAFSRVSTAFAASRLRPSSVTSRARDWGWLRSDKSFTASSTVGVPVSEASRWRPTSNSSSKTPLVAAPERK